MSLTIGLDPGLATFGYAVLRKTREPNGGQMVDVTRCVGLGVLRTKKNDGESAVVNSVRRVGELDTYLARLFGGKDPLAEERALFPLDYIDGIYAEAMSSPRSSSSAAKVAMAWGAIISNYRRRELNFTQMLPQDVKMRVVGTRDASKKHVERVLIKIYGRQIRYFLRKIPRSFHEHAYDALAVAHACSA